MTLSQRVIRRFAFRQRKDLNLQGNKWFGNKDFVKRKIEIQIDEKIEQISELNALSSLQTKFRLLSQCDIQHLSHFLRMYDPTFMAPLYEKWDNAIIKWAIDNLGMPDFSRKKWYRHCQHVLAPIASAGLGLNGLQRRSHAGYICAWSTVIDTFKSNQNRHTCNNGVTKYIDEMIRHSDLPEIERNHPQQASYKENIFILAFQAYASIAFIKDLLKKKSKSS